MANKKILIVDDEHDVSKLLETRLKAKGYDVDLAINGKEGLDKVKTFNPDLIILDILMPVMDGFEFFKTIKKDQIKSTIPIMVISARTAMKDTFEAIGADEFLEKPFDNEDFTKKVDSLLANKAILWTQNPYVSGKVGDAIKSFGYEMMNVEDEASFFREINSNRYKVIISHLALVTSLPKEFVFKIRSSKNRNSKIIIYSDAHVKGTENNNTDVIDGMRIKWSAANINLFFDSRIIGTGFKELIKGILG